MEEKVEIQVGFLYYQKDNDIMQGLPQKWFEFMRKCEVIAMTYREEFITFMVRSGVLTFGDFTTKSGRKTPYFVNTGNYKTGAQAAKLGDYYAACIQEHMPEGITCLFPSRHNTYTISFLAPKKYGSSHGYASSGRLMTEFKAVRLAL